MVTKTNLEDIIATHEKYTSVMNKREFNKFITEMMIRKIKTKNKF